MAIDLTRRNFLNSVAVGAAAVTAGQATYFAGPRPAHAAFKPKGNVPDKPFKTGHITFLTGFKNRFAAMLNWGITFIGGGRAERTITVQQTVGRVVLQPRAIRRGERAVEIRREHVRVGARTRDVAVSTLGADEQAIEVVGHHAVARSFL